MIAVHIGRHGVFQDRIERAGAVLAAGQRTPLCRCGRARPTSSGEPSRSANTSSRSLLPGVTGDAVAVLLVRRWQPAADADRAGGQVLRLAGAARLLDDLRLRADDHEGPRPAPEPCLRPSERQHADRRRSGQIDLRLRQAEQFERLRLALARRPAERPDRRTTTGRSSGGSKPGAGGGIFEVVERDACRRRRRAASLRAGCRRRGRRGHDQASWQPFGP